jgi:phage tail-like protein
MSNNDFEQHTLNYVTANRFYVEMESDIKASFSECSGLQAKVKKEVIFEGGLNDQQRILIGTTEYSDVTLKRGVTNDMTFCNWLLKTIQPGVKQRRNINILLFNQAGETMQCWTLIGAIPIAWKAPSLQASGNSIALEELTLAYEGLKVENAGGGATILDKRDKSGAFASR